MLDAAVLGEFAQQHEGRSDRVAINDEVRIGWPGLRDHPGGNPGCGRHGHDRDGDHGQKVGVDDGRRAGGQDHATGNGAEQNREECGAFDQSVAGRQVFGLQMFGENTVFDRPEQGSQNAKAAERDEQQRDDIEVEAGGSEAGDRDLVEFQPLSDAPFVVLVGDVTAECGEDCERGNQDDARQSNEDRALLVHPIEDEQGQRCLHEVIVQRREELAPEQGSEPTGLQQRKHRDLPSGWSKGRRHLAQVHAVGRRYWAAHCTIIVNQPEKTRSGNALVASWIGGSAPKWRLGTVQAKPGHRGHRHLETQPVGVERGDRADGSRRFRGHELGSRIIVAEFGERGSRVEGRRRVDGELGCDGCWLWAGRPEVIGQTTIDRVRRARLSTEISKGLRPAGSHLRIDAVGRPLRNGGPPP